MKRRSKGRKFLKEWQGKRNYYLMIMIVVILISFFIARSLPAHVNRYLYGQYRIKNFYYPKDKERQEHILKSDLQDIKSVLDELKKR